MLNQKSAFSGAEKTNTDFHFEMHKNASLDIINAYLRLNFSHA